MYGNWGKLFIQGLHQERADSTRLRIKLCDFRHATMIMRADFTGSDGQCRAPNCQLLTKVKCKLSHYLPHINIKSVVLRDELSREMLAGGFFCGMLKQYMHLVQIHFSNIHTSMKAV